MSSSLAMVRRLPIVYERGLRRGYARRAMEAALLAGVLAEPDGDAPRLVLADWWLQQGDPRGELVVVQCEAGRAGVGGDVKARLDARAAELLEQHEAAWLAPLHLEPKEVRWRRGFVEDLTIRWDRLSKVWPH